MCPWPFTRAGARLPYGPVRPSDTCWLPMMFSSWAPNLCVYVLPEAPEATCLHPSTPTLPRPRSWGRYHGASREVACCLGKGAVPGEAAPCHTQKHLHAPAPTPASGPVTAPAWARATGSRSGACSFPVPLVKAAPVSLLSQQKSALSQLFSISLENSPHRKNRLAECVCVWPVH